MVSSVYIDPRAFPKGHLCRLIHIVPSRPLSPEGKAAFVKFLYDKGALVEDLPTCILMNREDAIVDLTLWLDIYNPSTGAGCTVDEFLKLVRER